MSDPNYIVQWMNAIGAVFWPLAILLVALMFRRPIFEWLRTADTLSLGPVELRREIDDLAQSSRALLHDTEKLQILIAESRAIEIEIFLSYPLLNEKQTEKMQANLNKLNQEIQKLRKS